MKSVVRQVRSLAQTAELRVIEFEQRAASLGEWHYHSKVDETCYALTGSLRVEYAEGRVEALAQGQQVRIEAGKVHRLVNQSATAARYLVIQGPGVFDYIVSEPRLVDTALT